MREFRVPVVQVRVGRGFVVAVILAGVDGIGQLRLAIAERLAQCADRPFSLHEVRMYARELVLAGTLVQDDADQLITELTAELERLGILRVRRVSASATSHLPAAWTRQR